MVINPNIIYIIPWFYRVLGGLVYIKIDKLFWLLWPTYSIHTAWLFSSFHLNFQFPKHYFPYNYSPTLFPQFPLTISPLPYYSHKSIKLPYRNRLRPTFVKLNNINVKSSHTIVPNGHFTPIFTLFCLI